MKKVSTKPGIGIVGLSSPVTSRNLVVAKKAIAWLKDGGFPVVLGKTVFARDGYRTGSIVARVQDLHAMFRNDDIDVILNTTGGYNCNEILEKLDFDLLRKKRKWFVGYSDITALNLALFSKASVPTVHGASLIDFGDDPTCFERLFSVLANNKSSFESFPRSKILALPRKKKMAKGSIFAANLSTFNLLIGTPYMPSLNGAILFLEYDKEENNALPSLQRFLWQIRHAGIFDLIEGLVFGRLQKIVAEEENRKRNVQLILEEVTSGYRFPVISNAPFGHVYPSWQIINGQPALINGSQITAL